MFLSPWRNGGLGIPSLPSCWCYSGVMLFIKPCHFLGNFEFSCTSNHISEGKRMHWTKTGPSFTLSSSSSVLCGRQPSLEHSLHCRQEGSAMGWKEYKTGKGFSSVPLGGYSQGPSTPSWLCQSRTQPHRGGRSRWRRLSCGPPLTGSSGWPREYAYRRPTSGKGARLR